MELDAATLGTVGVALAGGIKWVFMRVDRQFAEAEAKAELARSEIKQELRECDIKHEKCESDRLKILEEVIGLRSEVRSVVKSQGAETKQQQANTADIKTLKDHAGDR